MLSLLDQTKLTQRDRTAIEKVIEKLNDEEKPR
jgi:hypothetical protein